MNDRLKFRVWVKKSRKMLNVGLIDFRYGKVWFEELISDTSPYGILREQDFEIMQCTGLKDKNGKLIFEGDIIKASRQIEPLMIDLRRLENIPDDERFIFRIDYKKDSCCYIFTIVKKFSDGDIDCFPRNIIPYYEVDELNKDSFEVIGNIHQNRELLEKGGK